MTAEVAEPLGTIVPILRYRDVAGAIEWLCNTFGFERQLVVDGSDGEVRYAELTFGRGMVMVGPADPEDEAGGSGRRESQVCYLFVTDAARHFARAKAAGAEIILGMDDDESAGRGYSCRDPEGHVWTFGTYDPFKSADRRSARHSGSERRRTSAGRLMLGGAVAAAVVASAAVAGWAFGLAEFQGLGAEASASAADSSGDGTHNLKELRERLAREHAAREAAEHAAQAAQMQLSRERSQQEKAAREARSQPAAVDELASERRARAAAQRAAEEARERLALAERSSQAASEQAAAERAGREAAERARGQAQDALAKERAERAAEEKEAEEEERAERQRRARASKRPGHPPRMSQPRPHTPVARPVFRPYASFDL